MPALFPLRSDGAATLVVKALTMAVSCTALAPSCTTRVTHPPPPTTKAPSTARTDPPGRPGDWLPADAAAGVDDPSLAGLLRDHWAWVLESEPVWATTLGVHRFDDRLEDESEAAELAALDTSADFLARARSLARSRTLSERDALTLAVFQFGLETDVARAPCELFRWSIDPRYNLFTRYARLPKIHPLDSEEDARRLLARYRAIAGELSDHVHNLKTGLARGFVANRETTRIAVQLIDAELSKPIDEWPFMKPKAAEHPGWSAAFRTEFDGTLERVVVGEVAPAFREYARFLRDDLLPRTRGPQSEGILGIPTGEACYRALVKEHTTIDTDPETLHRIGLDELERITAAMSVLGNKLFGTRALPKIFERLRTDPTLFFESPEEILEKAQSALTRAKAAVPAFFSTIPRTDCVVATIPDYEAPAATLAYYRPPHTDGTKPGEFFVNVYDAKQRRRFELEVLTFHESIPGHHLQIALAQELGDVPAFRKNAGATAFVEGWGLYAEKLADEMGLYTGDLDEMGRLSFEAWRAARLVVDTGLHAMHWTRERAVKLMTDSTALSKQNIDNEVDRYIVWPGQALAYKVGQLEILRLRRRAETELGAEFDLAAFHDAVLSQGALPLPLLAERIDRLIESKRH